MYLSRASSACREGAAPAAGQLAVAAAAGRRGRPALHRGRRADAAQPRGAARAALAPQQVRRSILLLGAQWGKFVLAAPSLDLEAARTSMRLLYIHSILRTRRHHPSLGRCIQDGHALVLLPC